MINDVAVNNSRVIKFNLNESGCVSKECLTVGVSKERLTVGKMVVKTSTFGAPLDDAIK